MGSGGGVIALCDPAGATVLLTFEGHASFVNSCGKLPLHPLLPTPYAPHTNPCHAHAPAFSPDGLLLATGSDDASIKLWRLLPPEKLLELHEQHERARAREQFLLERRQVHSGLLWLDTDHLMSRFFVNAELIAGGRVVAAIPTRARADRDQ